MKLRPDLDSAYIDPFYQGRWSCTAATSPNPQRQHALYDPRSIRRAPFMKSVGIGGAVYFG